MHRVRKRKIWAPRYKDIRLAPCPRLPLKSAIFQALKTEARLRGVNLGIKLGDANGKGSKLPDRRWAINVLSTLAPGHDFFKKRYRPPPIRDGKVVFEDDISDEDDFFDDLPENMDKKVKKRTKIFNIPKSTLAARRVQKYEDQIQRLRGQMD